MPDDRDPRHASPEELLPLVYDELRSLAEARLAAEHEPRTLQATALVHEAYLRIIGEDRQSEPNWDGRGHFFAAAAEAMRRILIDRARARGARKRGGDLRRLRLDSVSLSHDELPTEILDLDEALQRFEEIDPTKARLVHLRFYGGLTREQAATVLEISLATADRHWAYARAWLFRELTHE